MELYFNELSLKGKESIGVDCVSELIKVYRGLQIKMMNEYMIIMVENIAAGRSQGTGDRAESKHPDHKHKAESKQS